jgi:hypothetical protein
VCIPLAVTALPVAKCDAQLDHANTFLLSETVKHLSAHGTSALAGLSNKSNQQWALQTAQKGTARARHGPKQNLSQQKHHGIPQRSAYHDQEQQVPAPVPAWQVKPLCGTPLCFSAW